MAIESKEEEGMIRMGHFRIPVLTRPWSRKTQAVIATLRKRFGGHELTST